MFSYRNFILPLMFYLVFLSCGGNNGSSVDAVYIDPSSTVNGTGTISSPFNTWSSVIFKPGTTYLQKRGTVAKEQIIITESGTSSSLITIGAYGAGDSPVIDGSGFETGWNYETGSIYSKTVALESGEGLGLVIEDGAVLRFCKWDTDAAVTFSGAAAGAFSYDYSAGKVYVWTSDGSAPSMHTIEVSRRLYGIHGENVSYITIKDLSVRGVSLHGISFENSSHIAVSGCTVEKVGGAVISLSPVIYAGNGIEFGNASSDCVVDSVTVRDIFDSGFSPQIYDSNMHASNFTLENSVIEKCGFAGVEVAVLRNTDKENSSIDGVRISNVKITDCGTGWSGVRNGNEGRGIKISADIDGTNITRTINNVVIENCTVSGSKGEGVFLGGNSGTVTISRCRISGNNSDGILVQETGISTLMVRVTGSIIMENSKNGFAYNALVTNGITLYHNTFYNNILQGVNLNIDPGSVTITNNLFHTTLSGVHFYSVTLSGGAEIENNFFTEHGGAMAGYITAYTTAAAFNSGVTFAAGNIGALDPLVNSDMKIQGISSPCYGSGKTGTGVVYDFSGNPFRTPPSIGALEFY